MSALRLVRGVLAAAAAAVCAAAPAQPKSDWEIKLEERDWQESDIRLPAYPKPEDLIEFELLASGNFRFYVDGKSLIAGTDGTVRYTLVARSGSGTENVSFNGMRCKNSAHKVYATGRADKTWSPARNSEWKDLQSTTVSRQHVMLMRDFFCPAGMQITSREEGLDALQKGIHPYAVSNQPGLGKR